MKTIEETIMKWVRVGSPVVVDLDWNTGGHSMVIVDYESVNGYLTRWKVKNSWGDDFGDQGHAWYSYDDLRRKLRRIWYIGYKQ